MANHFTTKSWSQLEKQTQTMLMRRIAIQLRHDLGTVLDATCCAFYLLSKARIAHAYGVTVCWVGLLSEEFIAKMRHRPRKVPRNVSFQVVVWKRGTNCTSRRISRAREKESTREGEQTRRWEEISRLLEPSCYGRGADLVDPSRGVEWPGPQV